MFVQIGQVFSVADIYRLFVMLKYRFPFAQADVRWIFLF